MSKASGQDLLRRHLERKKLTPTGLARQIGSTQASVSRWLSGDRTPEARARIVLRKELGIPVEAWDRGAAS